MILAGEVFATKVALAKRAQKILHGPLRVLQGQEYSFVLALLQQHPNADQKIGCGVTRIRVVQAQVWKKNHAFELERMDGTRTDFSYRQCISPSSNRSKFAKACRVAIVDQVLEAKRKAFVAGTTLECPVTGELVTWSNCHVDHEGPWTFLAIVEAFIADRAVDVDTAVDLAPRDGETEQQFANPETRLSFQIFHALRARLRVVSARANLSTLRKRP